MLSGICRHYNYHNYAEKVHLDYQGAGQAMVDSNQGVRVGGRGDIELGNGISSNLISYIF